MAKIKKMTLREENEALKKACEMLIELARDYASGCTMYGDSSGPDTIEEVEDILGEKLLKEMGDI